MSGHDMSKHSSHSVISGQVAEFDDSMASKPVHEPMMQKDCCETCDNDCNACVGIASCGHSTNHVSVFIIFNKDISLSQKVTQSLFEHNVQYHSQVITPDFRPPIV